MFRDKRWRIYPDTLLDVNDYFPASGMYNRIMGLVFDRVSRHHMHQQPPQAPRCPKSVCKSAHCFPVTGWTSKRGSESF